MALLHRRSLLTPFTIILAGALLSAAVVGAVVAFLNFQRGEVIKERIEHSELHARVLEEQTTRTLNASSLAMEATARVISSGADPTGAEVAAMLRQTLISLKAVRSIAIVSADARVLASTDAGLRGRRLALARLGPPPSPGRERLGGYVRGRGLIDMENPPALEVGFIPLQRTLIDPQQRRLTVIALLNPDAFANFAQVMIDADHTAAALLTFDGLVLAATPSSRLSFGTDLSDLPPFREFLPAHEFASWRGAGLQAGARIASFRALRTRPWLVIVDASEQASLAPMLASLRWLLGAALVGAGFLMTAAVLAARNLAARERTRRRLESSQALVVSREAELRSVFSSVQELLFSTDAAGRLTTVNDPWPKATGRTGEELLGRSIHELVMAESRADAQALFLPRRAAAPLRTNLQMLDGCAVARTYSFTVVPLFEAGQLIGFVGSGVDLSEIQAVQEALVEQLSFINSMMDNSPLPMSVFDADGNYLRVNRAWEAFTGRDAAQVLGQPAGSFLPTDQRQPHEERDAELMRQGGSSHYEATVWVDGCQRDLVIHKATANDASGKPVALICAFMDVTNIREAERTAEMALGTAEEALKARSEFIANISHELRTPLQTILGFAELGKSRAREQPRLQPMFYDIHSAGRHMLALVNDLLDLSKMEITVESLELRHTDLGDLMRGAMQELSPLMNAKSQLLDLVIDERPMVADVDAPRMRQVLRNVVANAVKFSPAGSTISVRCEWLPSGEISMRVADRGPGIPEGELELVFDAFVQSSNTKDGSGGTGLGLAICRKIMTAHRGRIEAANRSDGGCVFDLVLPSAFSAVTEPVPL